MDAKEILKKIKGIFEATTVAPVVPAAPAKLSTANFPVDNGQPVYVDTSDDGIADIDTGDAVYSDEAMTQPYPDGTYTLTGTSFGFTVAAGVVSAVTGTMDPVAATPPPMQQQNPLTPQFEAMQKEFAALKTENENLKKDLSAQNILLQKHEKVIPGLFELAEELVKLPTAEPATLNDAQKEKFARVKKKEDRIEQLAKTLKDIKKNN